MRRIIHNTTAIAACLSLLAPHLAVAQQAVGAAGQEIRLAQQAGEEAPPLTKAERAARKAEREARKAEREQAADREGDGKRPAEARRDRDERRPAEPRRARGEERPAEARRARDGDRPAAAERGKAAAEERSAPERADGEKPRRRGEGERARAAGDDDLSKALAAERDKQAGERAEREGRAERRQEDRRAGDRPEPRRQDRAADERPRPRDGQRQRGDEARAPERDRTLELAGSAEAERRAGNMKGLAGVLASEVGAGLSDGDLRCASGGQPPCGKDGLLMTPKGVVVERNDQGRLMLAPARSQMFRADAKGGMRPRVAEEGTAETEAAREAARETSASAIIAALQEGGRGERREERVTRDRARSSSQDFATSLQQALQGADRRQDRAGRDDDGKENDLAKALLLGLGAVAVGSYLNNNRQVALSTPDRVVVTRADGSQEVIKDDVALLRQPGSTVETESFDDGSSRSIVTRADGSKVVTIRDADLRVLRRTLIMPDGRTTRLIDDTQEVAPVDVASLPEPAPVRASSGASLDEAALREALRQESAIDRRFTLGQIRNIPEVRALVAPVDLDAITFDTGSAAIKPDQARQLSALGKVIQDAVAANPHEIFMIEGHTDTVGSGAMNLALSDRRAESVALALAEYFDVPPENLVVQGYGEQFLKVRAEGDIRENRRASVRRITDLLQTADAG